MLVVIAHFLYLGFHDQGLKLDVDRVLALLRRHWIIDSMTEREMIGLATLIPQFNGVEPLGQGFRDELMRQVILNLYHGHGC